MVPYMRPEHYGRYSTDDISNAFSLVKIITENTIICFKFHWSLFLMSSWQTINIGLGNGVPSSVTSHCLKQRERSKVSPNGVTWPQWPNGLTRAMAFAVAGQTMSWHRGLQTLQAFALNFPVVIIRQVPWMPMSWAPIQYKNDILPV